MPGPLSATVIRNRVAWLAGGGGDPLLGTTSTFTVTSGRMPASSAASSALSTASLTQVRRAFRGLSKPRRWRFLVKNSETEISRWRAPISTAETPALGGGGGVPVSASAGAVGIASLISDAGPRARVYPHPPPGSLRACPRLVPFLAGIRASWAASGTLGARSVRVGTVLALGCGWVVASGTAGGTCRSDIPHERRPHERVP